MGTIKGVGEDIKGWVGSWKDDGDDLSIERAMIKAQHMDVIVVCIGEETYAEKPGDIRSLELPSIYAVNSEYGVLHFDDHLCTVSTNPSHFVLEKTLTD